MSSSMSKYLEDLSKGVEYVKTAYFQAMLDAARDQLKQTRVLGGTVWLLGNGGSAALASHMATDLQLGGFRAIALTDVAAVTTYANDVDYSQVFVEQLNRLCTSVSDSIIAISCSGNSPNVSEVADRLLDLPEGEGPALISLTGGIAEGGKLWKLTQRYTQGTALHIPTQHMGVSQDLHQTVLHLLAYHFIEEERKGK